MKFNIPMCATRICHNDLDQLEDLIRKKYKKMIWFYRLIESYGDQISDFEYDDSTNDSELVITLDIINENNVELIYDGMQSKICSMESPVEIGLDSCGTQIIATLSLPE